MSGVDSVSSAYLAVALMTIVGIMVPLGAFVTTCNGRGEQLFGGIGHDTATIRGRLESPPMAGFFAAGEFGPIAGSNIIHGHTVVATILR